MASEQFKLLQSFVREEFIILHGAFKDPILARNAARRPKHTVLHALAKEFVFNTVRAYRIVEHAHQHLRLDKDARKNFLKAIKPLVPVRDVNEHGHDPSRTRKGKSSSAAMHSHLSGMVAVDETSLVFVGPDVVLMGPLNLAVVHNSVDEMLGNLVVPNR